MSVLVVQGDARYLPLPDGCVDLVVTSPPYFGLRSYTDGGEHYDGQIGSEATPGEYVDALVACTAEWVRVLKPSGSLFVNLGDKYNSAASGQNAHIQDWARESDYRNAGTNSGKASVRSNAVRDFQPKSLLGLPWRYALACIDQLGLILRAEIVWAKPNGLPESVTDRVRRAHEQVFHFTVRPRYYSAVDEIREPYPEATLKRYQQPYLHGGMLIKGNEGYDPAWNGYEAPARKVDAHPLGKLPGSVWSIPSQPLTVPPGLGVDHFAAFPMELPRRLILGWSPSGVCTGCGEGRRPLTQVRREHGWIRQTDGTRGGARNVGEVVGQVVTNRALHTIVGETCACRWNECCCKQLGTRHPNCLECQFDHGECQSIRAEPPPTRPSLIVDPFGGTGTTALLANVNGRNAITVDRSADYCRIATWRTRDPGERARAMLVPKPEPVHAGQASLFDIA